MGNAFAAGILLRFADSSRIIVDADTARAVLFRGFNHNATIAAAEIVNNIVRLRPCEIQHLVHYGGRRADIRCVDLHLVLGKEASGQEKQKRNSGNVHPLGRPAAMESYMQKSPSFWLGLLVY